jgi:hypothetical protein
MLLGMRRILPDGWPGLVGIAVLVGGSALAVGTPRLSEVGGFASSDFFFTDERGPDLGLATAGAGALNQEADAAAVALGDDGYAERSLTLVATFDTNADAREAADSVALEAPARMLIVDRILVAYHLVPDPEDDPVPLTTQLTDLGADVLVQGDRFGDGQVVVDVSCRAPDHDAAAMIAAPLADYPVGYPSARPPWVGPPLTDDEVLARSTYRRWAARLADAFANDPWMSGYADRFLGADSEAEYAALNAELEAHVQELQAGGIEGEVHPEVAALLASAPSGTNPAAYTEWQFELSRLMGPLPTSGGGPPSWLDQRQAAYIAGTRAVDDRVEFGWVTFNRFELGFTGLLAYVDQQGCEDVRVRLADYDEVRLD